MPVIAGVALGGALGASARWVVDRFVEARSEALFPWSTFTINITGCFLIGIATESLVDRHHIPAWIRVGLIVGVLGGYTTFSTFAQEALGLVETPHDVHVALAYTAGSVLTGVLAVYAGTLLGRTL